MDGRPGLEAAAVSPREVDEARRLLRDTTFTIAAIAEETGFANAQRFYTAFRKLHSTTPGAYRRSYRG